MPPRTSQRAPASTAEAPQRLVSVSGEFQRALSECSRLLHGAESGTAALASTFSDAARMARDNLCSAAEHTLDVWAEGPELPAFGSELELEEFMRASEHLCAISRVVLGR